MHIPRNIYGPLPTSLPLLLVLAMTVHLSGCAQAKLIRKSHAFYMQRQPGTVRVDPSTGEEVVRKTDTLITVYIETTKKEITWDTAWRNGYAYTVRAELETQTPAAAGTSKDGEHKIIITPQPGNFLWRLQLLPIPGVRTVPAQEGIRIRAIYKKSATWHRAAGLVELEPVPSVWVRPDENWLLHTRGIKERG